jgi:hypothetical protein
MSGESLQPPRGRMRVREPEARYLLDLLRRDRLRIAKQVEFYDARSDIPAYAVASKPWRDALDHTISLVAELARTAGEMGWRLDR